MTPIRSLSMLLVIAALLALWGCGAKSDSAALPEANAKAPTSAGATASTHTGMRLKFTIVRVDPQTSRVFYSVREFNENGTRHLHVCLSPAPCSDDSTVALSATEVAQLDSELDAARDTQVVTLPGDPSCVPGKYSIFVTGDNDRMVLYSSDGCTVRKNPAPSIATIIGGFENNG